MNHQQPTESEQLASILEDLKVKLPIKATEIGWEKIGEDFEEATAAIEALLVAARKETEKAYGGCHLCYGKGYATVKTQHTGHGTDGDIGGFEGPYKRDMPVQMKFCTCDRGKQLKELLSATGTEGA